MQGHSVWKEQASGQESTGMNEAPSEVMNEEVWFHQSICEESG